MGPPRAPKLFTLKLLFYAAAVFAASDYSIPKSLFALSARIFAVSS